MTEKPAPERRRDESTGLVYRLRTAEDPSAPAYFLFHGLTGDEEVMWVIESGLPGRGFAAAPRGIFEAAEGGYSWLREERDPNASLPDFSPAVEGVTRWVGGLAAEHGVVRDQTVFVGFSQGAALAFALAAARRELLAAVVCLSGLLPQGDLAALEGLPVFWGHGTRDDTLPIERARRDVERLRAFGAQVHFCEADVGHKVGVECMRGLRDWLDHHLGPGA